MRYSNSQSLGNRIRSASLLVEAALCLLAARIALAVVPFRHLRRWIERPMHRPELSGDQRVRAREEIRSTLWILQSNPRIHTTCLQDAIAAQAMLRQRGVGTTLYYGAATRPGEGLAAHAWLQDGDTDVVGDPAARSHHYHVLARYPDHPP